MKAVYNDGEKGCVTLSPSPYCCRAAADALSPCSIDIRNDEIPAQYLESAQAKRAELVEAIMGLRSPRPGLRSARSPRSSSACVLLSLLSLSSPRS